MNRFILGKTPRVIAAMMCDQHIVKMLTEEGQMISHVIRKHMPHYAAIHDTKLFRSLSAGHAQHPCTTWLEHSRGNFTFGAMLFQWMSQEYEFRFGRDHGTSERMYWVIMDALNAFEFANIPEGELTPHPQCFGDLYDLCSTSEVWPVQAYRAYYRAKQFTFKRPMRWTYRHTPNFMQTQENAA